MTDPASAPKARAQPTWGEQARFGLGVAAVALLSAGFAIAFRGALLLLLRWFAGSDDVVSALAQRSRLERALLPALGGLAAGGIGLLVAREKPQGVGAVMEAVVLGRVQLALGPTLLKSLSSFFAILSGGSLGREGPLIQFGGAAGKWVSDRLQLSARDARRLIAAGTAAGFAAAYNTPFAAVLFVLEVVSGVIVLPALIPALVATALSAEATRLLLGAGPIYGQRVFQLRSPWELALFALLGVIGALGAQLFMRLLSAVERLFHALPGPTFLRPALGGLGAGGFIAVWPEVAGNGYEPLNQVLDARWPLAAVAWLVVAKALATSASVGSGSPGGVFTPSLLLGGGLGYVYGSALQLACGTSVGPAGGYALVGMAVMIAATTHAPLLAAVMAFELSGDYAIVLPLCLATALATAVSRSLRKDSIYTAELTSRGVGWELTFEGRRVS